MHVDELKELNHEIQSEVCPLDSHIEDIVELLKDELARIRFEKGQIA